MLSQRFVIHLLNWLLRLKGQGTIMLFNFWNWLFCINAKSTICYSSVGLIVLQKTSIFFVIHLFDWLFLLKDQGTIMLFIFWNWLFCIKANSLICYSSRGLIVLYKRQFVLLKSQVINLLFSSVTLWNAPTCPTKAKFENLTKLTGKLESDKTWAIFVKHKS